MVVIATIEDDGDELGVMAWKLWSERGARMSLSIDVDTSGIPKP